MKDSIFKEHFYNHSINDVWHSITDAEEIGQWFLKTDFKAEKGAPYTLTYDDGVITGTVLEVNPVYKLVYSWMVGREGVETTVTWSLEEKDGGTLLKLEHTGISAYEGEMATTMFNNFNGGWDNCIDSLGKHLSGKVNA